MSTSDVIVWEFSEDTAFGIDSVVGGLNILLLCFILVLYEWGSHKVYNEKTSSQQQQSKHDHNYRDPHKSKLYCWSTPVIFKFTSQEVILLVTFLCVELGYFLWLWIDISWDIDNISTSKHYGNDIYEGEAHTSSEQSRVGKLAVFLRFIELQSMLLWTLHEQRAHPLHYHVLVRLVSMVSTFVIGFAMVVMTINEKVFVIQWFLILMSFSNFIVCIWAIFLDFKDENKWSCARKQQDNNSNNNNNISNSNNSIYTLNIDKKRANSAKEHNFLIIGILFWILMESVASCLILLNLYLADTSTMYRIFWDSVFCIDRIKIFILIVLVLRMTIDINQQGVEEEDEREQQGKRKTSFSLSNSKSGRKDSHTKSARQRRHTVEEANRFQDAQLSQNFSKRGASLLGNSAVAGGNTEFGEMFAQQLQMEVEETQNATKTEATRIDVAITSADIATLMGVTKQGGLSKVNEHHADDDGDDDCHFSNKPALHIQSSEVINSPTQGACKIGDGRKKNWRKHTKSEEEIIDHYCSEVFYKLQHSSHWNSITSTVIGASEVGKTLYIRALWAAQQIDLSQWKRVDLGSSADEKWEIMEKMLSFIVVQ